MRDARDLIDWDEFQIQAALVCYYLQTVTPHLPVSKKPTQPKDTFSFQEFQKLSDEDKHFYFVCAIAGAKHSMKLLDELQELRKKLPQEDEESGEVQ